MVFNKQEYFKLYHQEHRDERIKRARLWDSNNPVKVKENSKRWYDNLPDSVIIKRRENSKNWYKLNKEKARKKWQEYYKTHKEILKEKNKAYNKIHPRTGSNYSYDLRDAMMNVRIRDNNTCQWYGCGKTRKDSRIDVNHIFPMNKYPELKLIEQYMICYCLEHHISYHESRGDFVEARLLKSRARNDS